MRLIDGLAAVLVLTGLNGCASSPALKASLPSAPPPSVAALPSAELPGVAAPPAPVVPPAAPAGAPTVADHSAGDLAPASAMPAAVSAPPDEMVPATVGIPAASSGVAVHRISSGDVLAVSVFQVADLSTEQRVNERGVIVLPLVGAIAVGGLTTEQAEHRIEQALGKDYLQNPQVSIFVSEYANMNVTVGGQVQKPGVFALTGQTTLMQAIAQAGGVTSLANPKEVVVFRNGPGNGVNAYVVDLKAVERGDLGDPLLAAQDKVMVSQSGARTFIKSATDTLRGFVQPFYFY